MPVSRAKPLLLALAAGVAFALNGSAQRPSVGDPSRGEPSRKESGRGAEPTDRHKALAAFVGQFDQESVIRMGPGGPVKARSVAKGRRILGGRFVEVDSVSAPGEKLQGERKLIYGYDPAANVYTLYNIETSDLVATTATGTYDDRTRTFSFDGEKSIGAARMPFRWVLRLLDGGVIEQKILVQANEDKLVEVVTVVHTPRR